MINELKISKFVSLEEFLTWTSSEAWRTPKYLEAAKIAREGANLGRADNVVNKTNHTRQQMEMVQDVCGSVVNMDAYLSGEPENMIEFPVVEEPTKFLNLFVDIGENASVSDEEFSNKAIALASVIDELENNGYRIALSVGRIQRFDEKFSGGDCYDESTVLGTIIKIKEYHQVLSLGQLTGCCHPKFYRVLTFAHYEKTFRMAGGRCPSHMGRTVSDSSDLSRVLSQIADPDMVFIPNSLNANGSLKTIQSAVEMVNRCIHEKEN